MADRLLRHRYRAYPGIEETMNLSRTFGSCDVVFNDFLRAREEARAAGTKGPTATELSKKLITGAKKTPERAWVAEVSSVALQQALADADRAYANFFSSLSGKRKGRRVGHPRFRSRRDHRRSARFTANARFHIEAIHERRAVLHLPRIGPVPFVLSRPLPGPASSVTVIREADGRHYVSFVVRVPEKALTPTGRVCGIDVGLAQFSTILSSESSKETESLQVIQNPRYLKAKARAFARSQRSLARKKKGSANRAKARVRVAVAHRKVREARADHARQPAARIVADHDVICVEDLRLTGMARTRLAKSIHDAGLGQFLSVLAHMGARNGRRVVAVPRFFASTRSCSACGSLTGPTGQDQLGVRHWTCSDGGVSHDRDVNAARNLLVEGLRLLEAEQGLVAAGRTETLNACGAGVRPPMLVAVGVEAGRRSEGRVSCPA